MRRAWQRADAPGAHRGHRGGGRGRAVAAAPPAPWPAGAQAWVSGPGPALRARDVRDAGAVLACDARARPRTRALCGAVARPPPTAPLLALQLLPQSAHLHRLRPA